MRNHRGGAKAGGAARGCLLRLLAAALGVLLALAAAEGLVRALGLAPVAGVATVDERQFRRLPGLFVPGQRVLAEPTGPFPHRVTIDSLGYRGEVAVSRVKPTGEFRILYAGDSFTFGHNVHDEETLPARLEERLRGPCPAPRVVNAGVPGFTILGQAHQVERGMVLDPDVVVVMFFENDLYELVHVRYWDQLAANRRLKSRFPLSLVYGVMRESALWRLTLRTTWSWRARMGARLAGAPPPEAEVAGEEGRWGAGTDAARAEYRERLRALARSVEARGVPFLFVVFPSPESAARDEPARDVSWVVEMARDLGIPTLDLHRLLREEGRPVESTYRVPLDYHPSPEGHAWAAGKVAGFILETVRPPECRS